MSDLTFMQLREIVLDEFLLTGGKFNEREMLIERLKKKPDYELALSQFRCAASERVVSELLRRCLLEITA